MNILEVSILVADLTITLGGFVIFNYLITNRQKKYEKHNDSIKQAIFDLETSQRYELKFELQELKHKVELLEVKVSKSNFDITEIKQSFSAKKESDYVSKTKLNPVLDKNNEQTKPTESVKNEVVELIKKKEPVKRGRPSKSLQKELFDEKKTSSSKSSPINYRDFNPVQTDNDENVFRKNKPSCISEQEVEREFKRFYKMTYYGFREKYGEEKLLLAKKRSYHRVYYYKIEQQKKKNQ